MESRGKRLVSMIYNRGSSQDNDEGEIRCSSNSTVSLNKEDDDGGVRREMERMFDSDDSDKDPDYQVPCSSTSTLIFNKNDDYGRVRREMERTFNSDDSGKDSDYCPQSELIELSDLIGTRSASLAQDNSFLNFLRDLDEDDNGIISVNDLPRQELIILDSQDIVIYILDQLLKKVFDATKSRKRWNKPDPNNWKVNVAKKRRSDGLPYITKNKERKPKVPKDIDCSKCFFKCNLPKEAREILCRHYWNLDFVEKKNFILSNIQIEPPKRVLAVRGCKKKRQFTTKCFFYHNASRQQVCQKYFCYTLAISSTVINNAIEKRNQCGLYNAEDKRGKKEPPNKTTNAAVNYVKKHIESFPTMEPHYIRKTSKRLYLDAGLSIAKMYQLYKLKCYEESVTPVSEITYRRIFCNNYNYSFFVPKKDQSLICSKYKKATPEEKLKIKTEYDYHLARKEACNAEKNKDRKRKIFIVLLLIFKRYYRFPAV